MRIHIFRWQILDLGTWSSHIGTGWKPWQSGHRWHRFLYWLAVFVGLRPILGFVPPVCLRILCSGILLWKTSVCLVFTKHSQVSVYLTPHQSKTSKLNSPLPLFSYFGVGLLVQELCFVYCGAWQLSSGCFCRVQGEVNVGLF
jgi:hypothetical protein